MLEPTGDNRPRWGDLGAFIGRGLKSITGGFAADPRPWWSGYGGALGAVACVSVLIGFGDGHLRSANVAMLYLVAVLVTASAFGSGPAIAASIAAFLTFDWFFVEPRNTLTVADPEEWVTLVLFLLTAIITGQLAAGQRHRAEEAEQREREAVLLHDVIGTMGDAHLGEALQHVAERLCRELRLGAVLIDVADDRGLVTAQAVAGEPDAQRFARTAILSAHARSHDLPTARAAVGGTIGRWIRVVPPRLPGSGTESARSRLQIVPVQVQGRRAGAIVLVGDFGVSHFGTSDTRLLSAAATQLGLAVERAGLRRETTETEILRRTDELKTALLHAVSHDLRTPLASIIAFSGSLRQTDVDWTDQERREFAESIEQEAHRLNRIVGNLLDLSRIKAGSLRPEKGWYDVGALVDDVVGRLRPITERHPLSVAIPEPLPPVELDYVEIDQVLSNLIENAAKHTPDGIAIEITACCREGMLRVAVTDHGPGIPPAAIERLFEPFYRAEGAGRRSSGTGLGLAVARGLVEAHGGRIWAENRPTGGARLTFTLPVGGVPETEMIARREDA